MQVTIEYISQLTNKIHSYSFKKKFTFFLPLFYATFYCRRNSKFLFAPENTKKRLQKLFIINTIFIFNIANWSKTDIFYRNLPLQNFFIMTLHSPIQSDLHRNSFLLQGNICFFALEQQCSITLYFCIWVFYSNTFNQYSRKIYSTQTCSIS